MDNGTFAYAWLAAATAGALGQRQTTPKTPHRLLSPLRTRH
ncbi:MAG: hypothetical protein ACI9TI_001897, partial [Natronomonas sp.]